MKRKRPIQFDKKGIIFDDEDRQDRVNDWLLNKEQQVLKLILEEQRRKSEEEANPPPGRPHGLILSAEERAKRVKDWLELKERQAKQKIMRDAAELDLQREYKNILRNEKAERQRQEREERQKFIAKTVGRPKRIKAPEEPSTSSGK